MAQRPSGQSNAAKGAWFEDQVKAILSQHRGLQLHSRVLIPIGEPPKDHEFDLVSNDGKVVVECKFISWMKGRQSPSAKMATNNEAIFYLSFLDSVPERYLAMPRVPHPSREETLAQHYW